MAMRAADRGTLRLEVERLGAKRVLEFGPGLSTFAFLDAGASVTTLEHEDVWYARAQSKFGDMLRVKVLRYANEPVIEVPELNGDRFDLAFVDSPQGTRHARVEHLGQEGMSRKNTVAYALTKAPVVLLHDAHRPGERRTLKLFADEGFPVELIGERQRIARITGS